MLGKIAKTIDCLEKFGATVVEKRINCIILQYKDRTINVLPTGSIYFDGDKSTIYAYTQFGKQSKFEKIINN